jgi:16S rRNA (guanine(966)-N(2))-methyltransferase RsmD
MKIITGSKKGKRLISLEGDATRPTSERLKEAIFSSIQFDIENRRVLDLFAGSGQMGLEALSRGAESAMFVDASMDAMGVIKANILATDFTSKSRTLVSDYRNYIRKASRGGNVTFDLVFIDPPYALACAKDALLRLDESGMLADGALCVLEVGEEALDFSGEEFSRFDVQKLTHYGKKSAIAILLYHKGE